jgi:hypothetical protein
MNGTEKLPETKRQQVNLSGTRLFHLCNVLKGVTQPEGQHMMAQFLREDYTVSVITFCGLMHFEGLTVDSRRRAIIVL